MKTCLKCKQRGDCKKICKEIEEQLPKVRGGGHEKEFCTDNIEGVYQAMKRKRYGGQRVTHSYSEESED